MTDNEQTERLRALLVQLRSARSVDTDIAGWNPLDLFQVTSTKLADAVKGVLAVCGEQPFCKTFRQLEFVLRRESWSDYIPDRIKNTKPDMLTNTQKLHLAGILIHDAWPDIYQYLLKLTNTSDSNYDGSFIHNTWIKLKGINTPEARALYTYNTLDDEYKAKHMKEYHAYTWLSPEEQAKLKATIPTSI
jgi:hypothetical protein